MTPEERRKLVEAPIIINFVKSNYFAAGIYRCVATTDWGMAPHTVNENDTNRNRVET